MDKSHSSSFAKTRWTLVLEANSDDSPAAKAALSELCEIYYEPIVTYIQRWRHDHDEDTARGQAHAFFESILTKESSPLGRPARSAGRFRSYMLGAVDFFLKEEHRLQSTAKRGGQATFVELHEQQIPTSDRADFDRDWAVAVVQ
ncbi:MAG: hypothetical protein AAF585_20460, partial [Verrucomicrobiota bacterium]